MINRQVLHLQAGWKSDEYFKTNIFKPVLWKPIQVDYFLQYFSTRDQCQQIDTEAGLLTRIF